VLEVTCETFAVDLLDANALEPTGFWPIGLFILIPDIELDPINAEQTVNLCLLYKVDLHSISTPEYFSPSRIAGLPEYRYWGCV